MILSVLHSDQIISKDVRALQELLVCLRVPFEKGTSSLGRVPDGATFRATGSWHSYQMWCNRSWRHGFWILFLAI